MNQTAHCKPTSGSKHKHALVVDLADKSSKVVNIKDENKFEPSGLYSLFLLLLRPHPSRVVCLPCFDRMLNVTLTEFWEIEIPDRSNIKPDCWDLFMNKDGTYVRAESPDYRPVDEYFLGSLNLQKLGYRHRRQRQKGNLAHVYIYKTS